MYAVALGDADALGEVAERGGGDAAAAQSRQRRHPRIVPAADMPVADQLGQPALGQYRIGQLQAREFVLPGPRRHRQVLDEPVVERPVILEFQGADGMGDVLDGVGLAMGEVIGGIDAPGVAGARMGGMQDAVHRRVAHVHVAGRHVHLGAQHPGTVGEFAGPHPAEQIQVLFHRSVAIGTVLAGFGQGAAIGAHLFRRKIVHIGLAGADQILGPVVKLLEVIGGKVQVLAPVEPQPQDVALDGFDEFQSLP